VVRNVHRDALNPRGVEFFDFLCHSLSPKYFLNVPVVE
jgi:hypothetical protein